MEHCSCYWVLSWYFPYELLLLFAARYGHTQVLHGGKLWIFGGHDGKAPLNDTWFFDFGNKKHDFNLIRCRNEWMAPGPIRHCSSGSVQSSFSSGEESIVHLWRVRVYQETFQWYLGLFFRYDFVILFWEDKNNRIGSSWFVMAQLQVNEQVPILVDFYSMTVGPVSFALDNKVYIFGGQAGEGGYTTLCDMHYLDTGNWFISRSNTSRQTWMEWNRRLLWISSGLWQTCGCSILQRPCIHVWWIRWEKPGWSILWIWSEKYFSASTWLTLFSLQMERYQIMAGVRCLSGCCRCR